MKASFFLFIYSFFLEIETCTVILVILWVYFSVNNR